MNIKLSLVLLVLTSCDVALDDHTARKRDLIADATSMHCITIDECGRMKSPTVAACIALDTGYYCGQVDCERWVTPIEQREFDDCLGQLGAMVCATELPDVCYDAIF